MISNIGGDFPYRMMELYDKLNLAQSNYGRWVKSNLLENYFEGLDYIIIIKEYSKRSPGQQAQDYLLKRRTAEELALLSRTPQGKELRKWLLDLKDEVENYERLTHEQVLFLIDLIKVFSFVTHQEAAQTAHLNTFVSDGIDEDQGNIYARFHIMRNAVLKISPEQIKERVQRFYDEENKLINKTKRRDILAVINKYELIGHASFDFLKSIGKPSEVAIKVMDIVFKMAEKMQPNMKQSNKEDLFDKRVPLNETIIKSLVNRSKTPDQLN